MHQHKLCFNSYLKIFFLILSHKTNIYLYIYMYIIKTIIIVTELIKIKLDYAVVVFVFGVNISKLYIN